MAIEYRKGDIFKVGTDVVAHGVNCCGAFNKGIAKQIRKEFPVVYDKYMEKHNTTGWKLGEVQFVEVNGFGTIANCSTQLFYNINSKLYKDIRFIDYGAIEQCFYTLRGYSEINNKIISMPKIGCGLGGGEWSIVEELLERVFCSGTVVVVEK